MAFVKKILARRRRPSYRRKTGYRRSYRRNSYGSRSSMSEARANLAVYANPFSTSSTSPRIPDNKVYSSCGIRLQAVGEFTNDTTAPMNFLLFPGINNSLLSTSCVGLDPNGALPFTNHARLQNVEGDITQFTQDPAQSIHKWRTVSCGMKVTLINNSDENDGWFEAIRIQGSFDSGFGLRFVDGKGYVASTDNAVLPAVTAGNLVEHPTYITGKLRDIHKYMFQLNPQGSDHEFQIVPRDFSGSEANQVLVDNENFDMVFLRIYGRPGASTPTRVMVHVVHNQEIVYDEGSTMVRYHGNTRGSALMVATARKRILQNPASQRAAKRPRTAYASYSY